MMRNSLLDRKRRGQRGAALVEAAVVIPVMLVFLGTIMFTHRSYTTKIDKQTATRSGTLFFASHACEGEIPKDVGTTPTNNDVGASSKADQGAGKIGGTNSPGATSAVSRDGNWARSMPDPTPVNGSAIQDRTTVSLTRKVYAGSEVACNEPVFESKWTAVFKEIGSMYKSHGGF